MVNMAPSSKRAALVRRAALEPERRVLPFELDDAAPKMIRRQDIDAHALAVALDPTLGKAEPVGLGAQFHEPPRHGPVSRSKTFRNATRNRSEPASKAFT
jgi:hypothetical protein